MKRNIARGIPGAVMLLVLFAGLSAASEGYVIGDEDVLQISVWGNQELNVQVPVRPDGMISFPLVGDIKAAGKSPRELKEIIEKELARFMKAPTVSVIITAVNSFKVYVIGEGTAASAAGGASGQGAVSGAITFRKKSTLLQLLAMLGSLKNADLDGSFVLRDGRRLSNNFAALVKGDMSQDIELKPDDVIFMPDNFDKRVVVVGAVKTPSAMMYREGLTALLAVLNAGGFTEFAKQNDVVIVRRDGGPVRTIEVRLKDVIKDGDISKDMPLKPGDLIVVKTGMF